jgi:hypothetical protein
MVQKSGKTCNLKATKQSRGSRSPVARYADASDVGNATPRFQSAAARRFLHRYTAAVADSFTKMLSSRLKVLDLELQRRPKPQKFNITRFG